MIDLLATVPLIYYCICHHPLKSTKGTNIYFFGSADCINGIQKDGCRENRRFKGFVIFVRNNLIDHLFAYNTNEPYIVDFIIETMGAIGEHQFFISYSKKI